MRANSFSLKVISSEAADRIGDSSVSRTSHCSPPMFDVMTLNTFRARSSGSPAISIAAMVLAKVGASALFAIAAMSARCSSMPSRMASRILGAVTLSQGGTPSYGPVQGCNSSARGAVAGRTARAMRASSAVVRAATAPLTAFSTAPAEAQPDRAKRLAPPMRRWRLCIQVSQPLLFRTSFGARAFGVA